MLMTMDCSLQSIAENVSSEDDVVKEGQELRACVQKNYGTEFVLASVCSLNPDHA